MTPRDVKHTWRHFKSEHPKKLTTPTTAASTTMAETTTTASPTALAMELQNEKRKLAMDLARQLEDAKRQRREAASGGSGAPSIAAAAAADEPVSRADVLREIANETEVTPSEAAAADRRPQRSSRGR